jgi:hypothetical protein
VIDKHDPHIKAERALSVLRRLSNSQTEPDAPAGGQASRDGAVVFEASVATDPAIIFGTLAPFLRRLERVGHEAGSVSP